MLKDIDRGSYDEYEGKVWFNLFEKYISFSAEDSADLDYITVCANYLNSLPESTIESLCQCSIKYCNSFLNDIGENVKVFSHYRDVLKLISPSVLIVPDPENGQEPVVWMELNCEWEAEHGMEWVIRDDEVLYVGGFNGTDPWSEIQKDVPWNYA